IPRDPLNRWKNSRSGAEPRLALFRTAARRGPGSGSGGLPQSLPLRKARTPRPGNLSYRKWVSGLSQSLRRWSRRWYSAGSFFGSPALGDPLRFTTLPRSFVKPSDRVSPGNLDRIRPCGPDYGIVTCGFCLLRLVPCPTGPLILHDGLVGGPTAFNG